MSQAKKLQATLQSIVEEASKMAQQLSVDAIESDVKPLTRAIAFSLAAECAEAFIRADGGEDVFKSYLEFKATVMQSAAALSKVAVDSYRGGGISS